MVISAEKSLAEWMTTAVKRTVAPHAKTIIIKDCGHVIPEEKPDELAGYLSGFFTGK